MTFVPLLRLTSQKPLKQDRSVFARARSKSKSLRCLCLSASSSERKPASSSVMNLSQTSNLGSCEKLQRSDGFSSNVERSLLRGKRIAISEVCHCLNMTEKEFCLKGGIFTKILKNKLHELFKANVQLREDYLRVEWSWTEQVGKRKILILPDTKSISNLGHYDWSCIRRISEPIKLKWKTAKYVKN